MTIIAIVDGKLYADRNVIGDNGNGPESFPMPKIYQLKVQPHKDYNLPDVSGGYTHVAFQGSLRSDTVELVTNGGLAPPRGLHLIFYSALAGEGSHLVPDADETKWEIRSSSKDTAYCGTETDLTELMGAVGMFDLNKDWDAPESGYVALTTVATNASFNASVIFDVVGGDDPQRRSLVVPPQSQSARLANIVLVQEMLEQYLHNNPPVFDDTTEGYGVTLTNLDGVGVVVSDKPLMDDYVLFKSTKIATDYPVPVRLVMPTATLHNHQFVPSSLRCISEAVGYIDGAMAHYMSGRRAGDLLITLISWFIEDKALNVWCYYVGPDNTLIEIPRETIIELVVARVMLLY